MFLDHEAQAAAADRLQRHIWRLLNWRFQQARLDGLKQSDLARRLGVSRPQIHVWLNDPSKITLKAAARLMLAMDGELHIIQAGAD